MWSGRLRPSAARHRPDKRGHKEYSSVLREARSRTIRSTLADAASFLNKEGTHVPSTNSFPRGRRCAGLVQPGASQLRRQLRDAQCEPTTTGWHPPPPSIRRPRTESTSMELWKDPAESSAPASGSCKCGECSGTPSCNSWCSPTWYGQVDMLVWWVKGNNVPPLVTESPNGTQRPMRRRARAAHDRHRVWGHGHRRQLSAWSATDGRVLAGRLPDQRPGSHLVLAGRWRQQRELL